MSSRTLKITSTEAERQKEEKKKDHILVNLQLQKWWLMSASHRSPGLCQCYAPQDRNQIKGNEGLLITALIISEWLSSTEVTKSANGVIFLFLRAKREKWIIHCGYREPRFNKTLALNVFSECVWACGYVSVCHRGSCWKPLLQPPATCSDSSSIWGFLRKGQREKGRGRAMMWCWSREKKKAHMCTLRLERTSLPVS